MNTFNFLLFFFLPPEAKYALDFGMEKKLSKTVRKKKNWKIEFISNKTRKHFEHTHTNWHIHR